MKRHECLFVDQVDGQEVFLYTDCYDNKWMANFNYLFSMRCKK